MTTSISGMSRIREELMPKMVLPTGTSNGARVTDTPETSTRLKRFAPMMLPMEREP